MTKEYIKKIYTYLAIYFTVLILIAMAFLCWGCATSFPLGDNGKYGEVQIQVSVDYFAPMAYDVANPPSYLPQPDNRYRK